MEQRPLRLGDIVDDYCPRERRITNHAIVVMTGADIHLTRCTACESEHPYKHAKLPLRRTSDAPENGNGHLVKPTPPPEPVLYVVAPEPIPPVESFQPAAASEPEADAPQPETYHRPLIRAALPKGIVPAAPRPLPDFTMRNIRNRDGRDGRSNGRRFSR